MIDNTSNFEIPVVLFMFKRYEKLLLIIDKLKIIKPKKIYLLSDGPRYQEEEKDIIMCREKILEYIDWDCTVIKRFPESNIGVFENIGLGAKWVFEKEEMAIFLEDDNLPEITFFKYCEELLYYYKNENKILWICGTNYLKDSSNEIDSSYFFTQNMMPCGWASWSNKFNLYYDGYLENYNNDTKKNISVRYLDKSLMRQDIRNWDMEKHRIISCKRPNSWDYQMSFTLRYYDLLGIVPVFNQIKNIGVDQYSIHGGVSLDNVMLRRFCYLETREMKFPLTHPSEIEINLFLEKKLNNIIKFPLSYRIKGRLNRLLKFMFGIDFYTPFLEGLKSKWKN